MNPLVVAGFPEKPLIPVDRANVDVSESPTMRDRPIVAAVLYRISLVSTRIAGLSIGISAAEGPNRSVDPEKPRPFNFVF